MCLMLHQVQLYSEDYFFYAVGQLNISSSYSQWVNNEISRAETIVANVRRLERDGMAASAEAEERKLFRLY